MCNLTRISLLKFNKKKKKKEKRYIKSSINYIRIKSLMMALSERYPNAWHMLIERRMK